MVPWLLSLVTSTSMPIPALEATQDSQDKALGMFLTLANTRYATLAEREQRLSAWLSTTPSLDGRANEGEHGKDLTLPMVIAHHHPCLLPLVLDHPALDALDTDRRGQTLFHHVIVAAAHKGPGLMADNVVEMGTRGFFHDLPDRHGRQPLAMALSLLDTATILRFLPHVPQGLLASSKNHEGHWLAELAQDADVMAVFLKAGVNPDLVGGNGRRRLLLQAGSHRDAHRMVPLLMKAGADATLAFPHLPLSLAKDPDAVLFHATGGSNSLQTGADFYQRLLLRPDRWALTDGRGKGLMYRMMRWDTAFLETVFPVIEMPSLLLSMTPAQLNAGPVPLWYALFGQESLEGWRMDPVRFDWIEAALHAGLDPNARPNHGLHPLDLAMRVDFEETSVDLLVQGGADVQAAFPAFPHLGAAYTVAARAILEKALLRKNLATGTLVRKPHRI